MQIITTDTKLRTFSEWLRVVDLPEESIRLLAELEMCSILYKTHGGRLELATSEEKTLLRKNGYQVDLPHRLVL